MINALIKFLVIALSFFSFGVIVQILNVDDAAAMILILSCVSILVPLVDFGYSRFSFSKLSKGISSDVVFIRIVKRFCYFLPVLLISSIFLSSVNNLSFITLLAAVILGASPVFLNVARYVSILNGSYRFSVILELFQPFVFLMCILFLCVLFDGPYEFYDIFLGYCLSHVLNFLLIFYILGLDLNKIINCVVFTRAKIKYLFFLKTFSVSLEQVFFAGWLFMPAMFYGHFGTSEDVLYAAVLQKMISVVVALYSIYSMKYLFRMTLGDWCYWGWVKGFASLFFGAIAIYIFSVTELVDILVDNIQFFSIAYSSIYHNYFIPFLFFLVFVFLHIQAFLLGVKKIKLRFFNVIFLVFLQAFLLFISLVIDVGLVPLITICVALVVFCFLVFMKSRIDIKYE